MAPQARTRAIATWTLTVLLALLFLLSGSGKLLDSETAGGVRFGEQFERWGYPPWARFPVGLAEIVGAALLLVPRGRPYAASGLTGVMAGAVATHLRLGETFAALFPLALASLAATLAWLSRPAWVQARLTARWAQVA